MLTCKDVSQLVTESMNAPLPFWRRMQVRMHLMMCRLCTRFMKQSKFLQEAAHQYGHRIETGMVASDATLSQETKDRIKQALKS